MNHLLEPFLRPAPELEPPSQGDRLRYLGTAGFVLTGGSRTESRGRSSGSAREAGAPRPSSEGAPRSAEGTPGASPPGETSGRRTFVLDPYLSRPGIFRSLFGRLTPNDALLARELPVATDVLVGHAHYDHALDAPSVCRHTGARLIGSTATAHIGRAAGLPEAQIVAVEGETPRVACGELSVTGFAAPHGKALLGRVPLPGDITAPPPWPPRVTDLRHGQVYNWLVDCGDARVLHVDSADYVEAHLEGVRADVLCLCAVGRQYRRDYTRRILEIVRPSVVVPCHWDDFTVPFGANPRQLPGVDVEGFVAEIRACGARAVVLGLGQRWSW